MRLTTVHRESFVRAVMNDIPDLRKSGEHDAVMSAVEEELEKLLPQKVFEVYKDPETRKYLMHHYSIIDRYNNPLPKLNGAMKKLHYYEINRMATDFGAVPASITLKEGSPLYEALIAYASKLAEVSKARQSLEGLIKGVSTLNRAKEVLPVSLHKYLPKETSNTATNSDRSLPVISNILSDLTSAGWPKAPAPSAG